MADVHVISDESDEGTESGNSSGSDLEAQVLSGIEPIGSSSAERSLVSERSDTQTGEDSVIPVTNPAAAEAAANYHHQSLPVSHHQQQQQPQAGPSVLPTHSAITQHHFTGAGDEGSDAGPQLLVSEVPQRSSSVTGPTDAKSSYNGGDNDEDGQCCPICFEDWTNAGAHRLVSLKCGHLFGQSCIDKWLRGQGGKCPQCNVKAKKKDVRVIYAKTLKVADTSDHDAALKELAREREARKSAELQAAETRLLLQLAQDQCKKLTADIDRQRQQLQHLPKPGSDSLPNIPSKVLSSQTTSKFITDKTVKICEAGGCRVMAYSAAMSTLCISQPSPNPLFPGFGLKKLSVLDMRTSQYASIHSKMIRDATVNPYCHDNIVLTASMDKTVAMTNLLSNTVIHRFTCPAPVWSCTWHSDDKNYFFAGMQNGSVLLFDTRNTAEHVQCFNTEGSRSPVVSLNYVKKMARNTFSTGGMLIGQLDRSVFYENITSQEYKLHLLPLEGSLTSMCVDDHTGHVLASFRPTQRQPSVRHVIYELYKESETCGCRSVQTFHGGSTQKLLSRSRLLAHPSGSGGLVVGGDEASQCVHVWDVRTGLLQQKFPIHTGAMDVIGFHVNNQFTLVALSDNSIYTAKWT